MAHETGTIASGDVTLFFRHFGAAGSTPIVILHGSNYYDSVDWIEAATALAEGREVVAFDTRGFGHSSWSPTRDYSYDAIMADITAVLDHFGWEKIVLLGHSGGGAYAILFAAHFPERVSRLVIVDHCPGQGGGARPPDHDDKIYPSPEDALRATSRHQEIAPGSKAWARLEAICKRVDGGFRFPRDRFFGNRIPLGQEDRLATVDNAAPWAELARVEAPTLIVYGTRSDRYDEQRLTRVRRDFPAIRLAAIDAGHDIPGSAPSALVEAVEDFLQRP